MAKRPPKRVTLAPDDFAAKHVGTTKSGTQFFLTNPFVPCCGDEPGREFVALYQFDLEGMLVDARIEDMGPRITMDEARAIAIRDEMLASLGAMKAKRIKVAPFKIERYGVEFGFIPQPPEEDDEDWSVTVEPGNFMCFSPPWTSGDYDT